ncbi:MAG: hypothetical protein M3159_00515 [Actinomycetota bacterium]|nr:hypothetical protein [Actinomycetota bacterium]
MILSSNLKRGLVALAAIVGLVTVGQPARASSVPNGAILFNRFTDQGPNAPLAVEVRAADLSGSADRAVVPRDARDARYSPDGAKIVYTGALPLGSEGDKNNEIFVADVDGSGAIVGTPTQLTHNGKPDDPVQANDQGPSWSPDGKSIVFSSNRETGNDEIYVMDAQGGDTAGLHRLTNNFKTETDDPADMLPVYSPDGSTIAFTSSRGPKKLPQIYLMDADPAHAVNGNASNQRPLFAGPDPGQFDSNPSWSPDGKHLAFDSNRTSNFDFEIYVADLSGTNAVDIAVTSVTNVTNSPSTRDLQPVFSPDGTKIAFSRTTSYQVPDEAVYVMDSDGQNPTLLVAHGDPTGWSSLGAPPEPPSTLAPVLAPSTSSPALAAAPQSNSSSDDPPVGWLLLGAGVVVASGTGVAVWRRHRPGA